ncbi:DUF4038 domain-containing protein [Plantactinospora sp. CA-290183]|uniref:apiosidase-like domain-containing protein n=1 Tax=Plantactinospora sp. CA-290183 TaxID=3240006 RepID=UPI003D92CB13
MTASSVETENGSEAMLGPERVVDGNASTRWASRFSDPQWVRVDLGTRHSVNRVVLKWENAYGRSYEIQVSNDDRTWTTAFSTTTGDGGIDDVSLAATARYVRVYATQRATAWGYSLWEFEIYGQTGPVSPTPSSSPSPPPSGSYAVRVSDNNRFLVKQDGQPFYYLADTAWELFHRQDREDTDTYLEDRAEKGFTVIQAVALAELDGVYTPNAYGYLPLRNGNPATPDVRDGPNNDYWDHVDYIVDKAESLGMYMGFLPTWGRWINNDRIFNSSNAYTYGRFLGERYKNDPIIWILGGDRPADTAERKAIWREMARGIAVGVSGTEDYGRVLMTYHSWAETSSSDWFHNDAWLDFNAIQSGAKRWNNPCLYECPAHDYGLVPVKPTVDIEVNYDDSVVNWDPDQCCYTDYDVRKGSYWSMFAGGFGITYGTRNIWQFWTPDRSPVSYPQKYWYDSLDLSGAFHVAIQKELMLSRPFLSRVPAQGLLVSNPGSEGTRIQATKDEDGAYAFVYIPNANRSVSVDLSQISGSTVSAWWFNPRDGKVYTQNGNVTTSPFGQFPNAGSRAFTTPSSGPDWVLVLDDASRGFTTPGT